MKKKRAVFLDRDGVINPLWYDPDHGTIDSPYNVEQFRLNPGVPQSINKLREMGFTVAIISNQPGIGKGKVTRQQLDVITDRMLHLLSEGGAYVNGVYYCLHHPDAILKEFRIQCSCRKPKSGLLLQAAEELDLDLSSSYMVGDGITDIQAGQAVGCTTVWIGRWKCDICKMTESINAVPDLVAANIIEAVQQISIREEE